MDGMGKTLRPDSSNALHVCRRATILPTTKRIYREMWERYTLPDDDKEVDDDLLQRRSNLIAHYRRRYGQRGSATSGNYSISRNRD